MKWLRAKAHARLTEEEIILAIKALQRSSQSVPEEHETFAQHHVRMIRETKLADRLRRTLC